MSAPTAMQISGFRGDVIVPDRDGYDGARAVWNGTVDRHPRLIARCSGTADVAAAVRFARDRRLEIAIRGGGHNVAGTAVCDDGIVIDLSAMRAVTVDPAQRTAHVGRSASALYLRVSRWWKRMGCLPRSVAARCQGKREISPR
jgi:FAD binding domain